MAEVEAKKGKPLKPDELAKLLMPKIPVTKPEKKPEWWEGKPEEGK